VNRARGRLGAKRRRVCFRNPHKTCIAVSNPRNQFPALRPRDRSEPGQGMSNGGIRVPTSPMRKL
jgi:hypothetical protein